MDNILLDVDKVVFEQKTPICNTRIMHGGYGYYYIEMANKEGFKLDSISYETMKELIVAVTKDLNQRGEFIND